MKCTDSVMDYELLCMSAIGTVYYKITADQALLLNFIVEMALFLWISFF
jgi:hypothetical protein